MPSNRGARTGTRSSRPPGSRAPAKKISTIRGGAPAQDRELRAQGRRTMNRLLDAGRFVFEKRGFHAARVDDIVKAAKTSHGTFYLYFANKEELFKALAQDAMTEMEALGDQLVPITPDAAGQAALREWIGKFVDTYAEHGTVIRSWTQGEIFDPELGRLGRELLLRLSSALAERMPESNGGGDGAAAGVACLSMLERFNYFTQARMVRVEREVAVDALTRAAFTGFFAVPDKGSSRRRRGS